MKAIEVNGEIKLFSTLPKSWSDENGVHLNIKNHYSLGFKDVIIPSFNSKFQEITNLHLEEDVYTYDVVEIPIKETISKLKEQKIAELKVKVGNELSKTDWYIIREADSGQLTPTEIRAERASLRTKSDTIEAEINALSTKKSVVLFDINL
jgi:hypothetical protein